MKKKKVKSYLFIIMLLFCIIFIPYAYSKYYSRINKKITINGRQPAYNVRFNANPPTGKTATGSMSNQNFEYGTAQNLTDNAYSVSGYTFSCWNTSADGSGTSYSDGELVNNLSSSDGSVFNLYAQWSDFVAEVNGVQYRTLAEAITAVPNNNVQTTVKLLANTSAAITIPSTKNILFDLQNFTISNSGNNRVIDNNGSIKIINGTIRSSVGYAAIDNEATGTLIMEGGQIIATGDRQAIYNYGLVEISGGRLSSSIAIDGDRGTIHNLASATLRITGGEIVSTTSQAAVYNLGTLTIGTNDDDPDPGSLSLKGESYGVRSSVNFNFYDGTIKGKTAAIHGGVTKVSGKEAGYDVATGSESIGGENYKTAYLAITVSVTFDPNQGSVDETTRYVESGKPIGELPIPTRVGYRFLGWFTTAGGGEQISAQTIITNTIAYFAHWEEIKVAEVNGVQYTTLQEAITAAPNGVETTVKLLCDTIENVTVGSTKNIVFNLQNYTISNDTTYSVITNKGIAKITNGTIETTSDKASVVNNDPDGYLTISGGNIIARGQRQAVYNDKGTVEITGGYMSSKITASGDRGTVHNKASSTMIIKGGTIVSTTNQGVYNEGTMTIGIKGGGVSTSSPDIQGKTNGLKSTTTFYYYDGTIKGETKAITDETKVGEVEPGYEIKRQTDGALKIVYLGLI